SDQLVSLVDWMATCAELVGAKFPDNAAEDSVSILPVLLGTAQKPVRETLVHHSINGRFAIREGKWKLCLSPGSGGWSVRAARSPGCEARFAAGTTLRHGIRSRRNKKRRRRASGNREALDAAP